MAVNFMYPPNDDTQNYSLCGSLLVVKTFRHSKFKEKSSMLLSQWIRNFGD